MKPQLCKWESKASLMEHLNTRLTAPLILGEGCEAPREFWSISFPDCAPPLEIGIFTSGSGVKPSALHLDLGDYLFIGHERAVSVISLQSKAICQQYELEGVFFTLLKARESLVVAIHELGAVSLSGSGKLLWTYTAHDIVNGWKLMADHLLIQIQGSENEEAVSLDTGVRVCLPT